MSAWLGCDQNQLRNALPGRAHSTISHATGQRWPLYAEWWRGCFRTCDFEGNLEVFSTEVVFVLSSSPYNSEKHAPQHALQESCFSISLGYRGKHPFHSKSSDQEVKKLRRTKRKHNIWLWQWTCSQRVRNTSFAEILFWVSRPWLYHPTSLIHCESGIFEACKLFGNRGIPILIHYKFDSIWFNSIPTTSNPK